MSSHLLSKSSFIKGLQCDKHLYLYKFHYKEMDEFSEMQQAIFKRGTNVGVLAQQLFPGGEVATTGEPPNYTKGIQNTGVLIDKKTKAIYEAAFQFNEVLVINDIIVRDGSKWNAYEVKSSTSVSETYLNDAALQYYILSNSGIEMNDFSIIYINNRYTRKGELDIKELFITDSVLEYILPKQDSIKENVERLKQVVTKKRMPYIEIGEHCHNPYKCGFFNYCRTHIPEDSIFDFSGMHLKKKYEMYKEGIIKLDDVPEDYSLNKNNQLQQEVYKKAKPIIDKEAIE
ncbi:MAG: Dna2/Cas4 domain-containing protein, partial [Ignavibacteria bacterium]|nr:Dna2/Cas4 domain-containing protein [Ignavibacteria bacterium]